MLFENRNLHPRGKRLYTNLTTSLRTMLYSSEMKKQIWQIKIAAITLSTNNAKQNLKCHFDLSHRFIFLILNMKFVLIKSLQFTTHNCVNL